MRQRNTTRHEFQKAINATIFADAEMIGVNVGGVSNVNAAPSVDTASIDGTNYVSHSDVRDELSGLYRDLDNSENEGEETVKAATATVGDEATSTSATMVAVIATTALAASGGSSGGGATSAAHSAGGVACALFTPDAVVAHSALPVSHPSPSQQQQQQQSFVSVRIHIVLSSRSRSEIIDCGAY